MVLIAIVSLRRLRGRSLCFWIWRMSGHGENTYSRMLEALRCAFRSGLEARHPLVNLSPQIDLLEEDNLRPSFSGHAEIAAHPAGCSIGPDRRDDLHVCAQASSTV